MFDSEDRVMRAILLYGCLLMPDSEDVRTCFEESEKQLKNYQMKTEIRNVEISSQI